MNAPMSTEGTFLLYLLEVSAAGTLPPWRTELLGDIAWLTRQEREAGYALGRMRDSLCGRIKRLDPGEPREFLVSLLAHCQDDDGGKVIAPRWPARNLGTVTGMIRDRMTNRRTAA